jgi:transposase
MEITEAQYERIKDALPVQRGNVRLSNLQVLNAVLYVAEQGCKWRGLPKRFGRWHTICLVPAFGGAYFSREWKEALWDRYCTGAPQRRRRSVERYSIVKRA